MFCYCFFPSLLLFWFTGARGKFKWYYHNFKYVLGNFSLHHQIIFLPFLPSWRTFLNFEGFWLKLVALIVNFWWVKSHFSSAVIRKRQKSQIVWPNLHGTSLIYIFCFMNLCDLKFLCCSWRIFEVILINYLFKAPTTHYQMKNFWSSIFTFWKKSVDILYLFHFSKKFEYNLSKY